MQIKKRLSAKQKRGRNKAMIDIHTHLLPGVDHGANNIDDSLKMLETLENSGVSEVYLTSHYYSDTESIESYFARYDKAYNELRSEYKGNIKLRKGTEVYISPYFGADLDEKLLLEGTMSMLIELPFWLHLPDWMYDCIERLVFAGVTPVVAHIERYPGARRKRIVKRLHKMGAVIHVDTLSVESDKFVHWCIKKGYVDIVASDYHVDLPYVSVRDALDIIEKRFGKEKADDMRLAPERLLKL